MKEQDAFTVGFMDYPNHNHRPRAGTPEEIAYCRGWMKGLENENASDIEWGFGRDSYFAHYDDPISGQK